MNLLTQKWRKLSLATQLTVVINGMFVILLSVFTISNIQRDRVRLTNSLQNQALLLLDVFDESLSNDLILLNVGQLSASVNPNSSLWTRSLVFDADGRLLVDTDLAGEVFNLRSDPLGERILGDDDSVILWDYNELLATKPIEVGGRKVGAIALYISTSSLNDALQAALYTNVTIGLTFLLLGSLFIIFFARTLVSPLQQLTQAAKTMAEGNIEEQVDAGGFGEVSQLATTFDEMRQEIKGAQDRLDNEVNQKTAELRAALENEVSLKQTLSLSLSKERELNSLRSNLINTVSHEFRTPLNAIIGYSEMLVEDIEESDDESTMYLDDINRIEKAGRHLLQLINVVLDLSKLEENNLQLDITTFDINLTISYVQEIVGLEMEQRGNQFSIHNQLSTFDLSSDEIKIRQILINLLTNAAKFTENGNVTFTILEDEEGQILFEIEDTGIGISEENLDRIFDSFFQVENELSRNYEGSGLGLAISSRFANLLGGQISIESELGVGSLFRFSLPRRIGSPELLVKATH